MISRFYGLRKSVRMAIFLGGCAAYSVIAYVLGGHV